MQTVKLQKFGILLLCALLVGLSGCGLSQSQIPTVNLADGASQEILSDLTSDQDPNQTSDLVSGSSGENEESSSAASDVDPETESDLPQSSDGVVSDEIQEVAAYILNISSKKIHLPSCSSVSRMKEENKAISKEPLNTLLEQGYSACGLCKPQTVK